MLPSARISAYHMQRFAQAIGTDSPTRSRAVIIVCIAGKALIYLLSADHYGFLSDELYFLDASWRPAAGYIDFPPLIAWLFGAVRLTLGDSLWAFRLVAALIGTATLLLAVDLCRVAGGGRVAQWLTACSFLLAPGIVSVQTLLTMNVLDQFWWIASCSLLLRYLRDEHPRWLWLLGTATGLAILTKLSILALSCGMIVALLTLRPGVFTRREFIGAGLVALLLSVPYLYWQITHDYPLVDFIRAYDTGTPEALVLRDPVTGLLITMGPLFALLWIPGAFAIVSGADRDFRVIGVAAWVSLLVFALAGVKFYFAVPALMLFTIAGAIVWERWCEGQWSPASGALMAVLLTTGLPALPTGAPLLPAAQLQALADFLRDAEAGRSVDAPAALDRYFPHFAEMHGWPELVELVEGAAGPDTIIVAAHYGQAGALNRARRAKGNRLAISGHMNYYLWFPPADIDKAVFVGFEKNELEEMFADVVPAGRMSCSRCTRRERSLEIFRVAEPRLCGAEIRERIRRLHAF